eukprot:2613422-Lingulodinium_polyedra.AAC.1
MAREDRCGSTSLSSAVRRLATSSVNPGQWKCKQKQWYIYGWRRRDGCGAGPICRARRVWRTARTVFAVWLATRSCLCATG